MSKLGVVEDTLFVPMLGRLYASEHCPQILYDGKALELKEKLPPELLSQGRLSQYTLLASAARSANLDRIITGESCCRSRSGRPISPETPLPRTGSSRSALMCRMLLFWSPPAACSTILRKARLWDFCGCSRGLERLKSSLTP